MDDLNRFKTEHLVKENNQLPPGPSEIEGGSSMTERATPRVWMKISPACEVSMCDNIFDLK